MDQVLSGKQTVTIEVDLSVLGGCTDEHLAMLWHVAQANPAPFADKDACELVERLTFEIVRRWLGKVPPSLYTHKPTSYYWERLRHLGKWDKDMGFVPHPGRECPSGCTHIEDAVAGGTKQNDADANGERGSISR